LYSVFTFYWYGDNLFLASEKEIEFVLTTFLLSFCYAFYLARIPIKGRLVNFMHRSSINKLIVRGAFILAYLLIWFFALNLPLLLVVPICSGISWFLIVMYVSLTLQVSFEPFVQNLILSVKFIAEISHQKTLGENFSIAF
jgi:hypothetical protein